MTYKEIHTAFLNESSSLGSAKETEVMAYCEQSGNDDAYSRWLDYKEEVACLIHQARMEFA